MLLRILMFCLFFTFSCKRESSTSATKDIDPAYVGSSHFSDSMFIPYSNIGYDPAFCAGTSGLHALAFNRARFYPANPPSLKCPAKFNTNDDKRYDDKIWLLLEQQGLNLNFTSKETIQIYGALNFGEFGKRNLANFAKTVKSLQNKLGKPPTWNVDGDAYVTFESMAQKVRQGNFLIIAVHATDKNPDQTTDNIKDDCISRGYRWDRVAESCDWSKQVAAQQEETPSNRPNADSGEGDSGGQGDGGGYLKSSKVTTSTVNSSTPTNAPGGDFQNLPPVLGPNDPGPYVSAPTQDRKLPLNHAILVVGANNDNSLNVYTTWSDSIEHWQKSLKISGDKYYINPVILRTIPVMAFENRDASVDLMKELNEYYGYTGPGKSDGCPPGNRKPGEIAAITDKMAPNPSENPDYFSFDFDITEKKVGANKFVDLRNIQGCPTGDISWTLGKTFYDSNFDPESLKPGQSSKTQEIAYARFKTKANVVSQQIPVESQYDRFQITGVCKDRNPVTYWYTRGQKVKVKK